MLKTLAGAASLALWRHYPHRRTLQTSTTLTGISSAHLSGSRTPASLTQSWTRSPALWSLNSTASTTFSQSLRTA